MYLLHVGNCLKQSFSHIGGDWLCSRWGLEHWVPAWCHHTPGIGHTSWVGATILNFLMACCPSEFVEPVWWAEETGMEAGRRRKKMCTCESGVLFRLRMFAHVGKERVARLFLH